MKSIWSTLPVLLLALSVSAQEMEPVTGIYNDCRQWTKINGVEYSRGVQFILNENKTMSYEVKSYRGNSQCLGKGESLLYTEKLQEIRAIGKFPYYLVLILKDTNGSGYYRLSFVGDTLMLENSDHSPEDYDSNRTRLLKNSEKGFE